MEVYNAGNGRTDWRKRIKERRQGELEMAREEPGAQLPLRLLPHLSFYELRGMERRGAQPSTQANDKR